MRWIAGSARRGLRRGSAIVVHHDFRAAAAEVLLERAFADSWGVRVGDTFYVRALGPLHVAGLVEAPDNVGFPLAKPRF